MIGTIIGWLAWAIDFLIGIAYVFWFFAGGVAKIDFDPKPNTLLSVWLRTILYWTIAILFIIHSGWDKLHILWLIPATYIGSNAIGAFLFKHFPIVYADSGRPVDLGDIVSQVILFPIKLIIIFITFISDFLFPKIKELQHISNAQRYNKLYKKGFSSYVQGNYAKALEALDAALKINPRSIKALRLKGYAFHEVERYDESIEVCNRILKLRPNDTRTLYLKGRALYRLDRYREALEIFEKIIEIEPDDFDAWYNKGLALSKLVRYGSPRERVLLVILHNIPPDAANDFHYYEEAAQAFDRAIQINTNDSDAWYMKGLMLSEMNRYEKVLDTVPESTLPPNIIQSRINRYEEALKTFKRAAELKPDDVYSWQQLGDISTILGRYEEAIQAFDRAIQINPEDEELLSRKENIVAKIKK